MIWQAEFGRASAPVMRRPELEGKPSPPNVDGADWTSDDSEEALNATCDAWNNQSSSRGFALFKYEIEH